MNKRIVLGPHGVGGWGPTRPGKFLEPCGPSGNWALTDELGTVRVLTAEENRLVCATFKCGWLEHAAAAPVVAEGMDPVPQGWEVSHPEPWDALTPDAQHEGRIHVKRIAPPYCGKDNVRVWSGPTLEAAMTKARAALDMPAIVLAAHPVAGSPAEALRSALDALVNEYYGDESVPLFKLIENARKLLEGAPTFPERDAAGGQHDDGWPVEIYLQAGDEPLGKFSEYDEVSWCDHPQGQSDVRYMRADAVEIGELVSRFLGWPLPDGVCPGVDRPIGTHLLNADQARAMILHVLAPSATDTQTIADKEIGKPHDLTIGEAFAAVGGWMNGGDLGYPTFGSMEALKVYTAKMIRSYLANTEWRDATAAPVPASEAASEPGVEVLPMAAAEKANLRSSNFNYPGINTDYSRNLAAPAAPTSPDPRPTPLENFLDNVTDWTHQLDELINGAPTGAGLAALVETLRSRQSVQILKLEDGMRVNFRAPDGRRTTMFLDVVVDDFARTGRTASELAKTMRAAIEAYPVAGSTPC